MPLTDVQRAKLEKYVKKGDRGREPVFVGREDLLKLVMDNADAAADGDLEGRTVCIAGPPGVGKTAFLAELMRRAKASGPEADPPAACVSVDPDALAVPHLVMDAISKQLPDDWGSSAVKKLGEAAGRIRSFSFLGAGASWKGGGDPGEGASSMPWGALDQAMQGFPPKGVICLTVDEAQGIADTSDRKLNVLLRSLHMGPPPGYSGPAVLVVLAGLPNTPDVVEKSISRMAGGNQRSMPNLTRRDSELYVRHVLNHFEVPHAEPGRAALTEWIVRESGNFPHHLRNAMESIAEGLLDADSPALSDLDGMKVENALRERRETYYRRRTEGAIGHIKKELGRKLREWRKGPRPRDKEEGEAALQDFMNSELDARTLRLMEGRGVGDSAGLIDETIRKGVLMTDPECGGCRCPIDSLISWMENGEHSFGRPFPTLGGANPRKAVGSSPTP